MLAGAHPIPHPRPAHARLHQVRGLHAGGTVAQHLFPLASVRPDGLDKVSVMRTSACSHFGSGMFMPKMPAPQLTRVISQGLGLKRKRIRCHTRPAEICGTKPNHA